MAWGTLTDAMLQSGRLWTPEISYIYMDRDWANCSTPVDWWMGQITSASTSFDIVCVFPDSWALDTTLDADAQLRLSIWLRVSTTGAPTGQTTVAFDTNSVQNSVTSNGTLTWVEIIRYWDGTLPTGATTATIDTDTTGGDSGVHRRVHDEVSSGPDSRYYFTFT